MSLWLPQRLRQHHDERLLRLAGDYRTRRWMPGYPCCCGDTCLDCSQCTGALPEQYAVTFTGVEEGFCGAGECDVFNDTFILTCSGACYWRYHQDDFWTCNGSSLAVTLVLYFGDDGAFPAHDYVLRLQITIGGLGCPNAVVISFGGTLPACDQTYDGAVLCGSEFDSCNFRNGTCTIAAV